MRQIRFIAIAALLALFAAAPSWSAAWEFHSIPVANTCNGWFLWPIGCTPWYMAPGGASVFNCRTEIITTLHGLTVGFYIPVNPIIIDPPTVCNFNSCNDLTITLTCYRPNADPALQKKQEYRLEKTDAEALKREALKRKADQK
jgi:hypothetical protein